MKGVEVARYDRLVVQDLDFILVEGVELGPPEIDTWPDPISLAFLPPFPKGGEGGFGSERVSCETLPM